MAEYYEDGEQVQERVTITSDGTTYAQESHNDGVRATVGKDYDWSYPSDGTANIWVGTVNTSTAIDTPNPNQDLWINITRPDGTEDTQKVTTGSDGNYNLQYELAGKPDGEYQARISGPNVSGTDYVSFSAGPAVVGIFPGIAGEMETGRTATVAVLITEDRHPVSGVTKNVSIRYPNGTEVQREVTSDADGYGTFQFTPPEEGRYSFDADNAGQYYKVGDVVGHSYTNNDAFRDYITTNNDAHINGLLYDNGAAYANKQIFVEIVNTTDYDNHTKVANISTTTDDYGQFLATWSPSDGQTGEFDIRVNASESDTSVALADPGSEIRVTEASTSDDGDTSPSAPGLTLYMELGDGYPRVVKPGGDINATIQLVDNGSLVTNTDVTIGTYYDYSQVPKGQQTVTTNSSGMATVTIDVPASAPDSNELTVEAYAEYNNSSVRRDASADIQRFIIDSDWDEINGVANYTMTATDPETGAGVAGVPLMISGETNGFHATTFGTASAETDAAGHTSIELQRPDYVKNRYHLGEVAPYESPSSFPVLSANDYDVTVNGLDNYEQDAGKTITFNYTATSAENVSARVVVTTYSSVDDRVLYSGIVDAGENASFTIPTSVPDDTYYNLEVRAVSESGDTGDGYEGFRVNNTGTTSTYDIATDSATSVTDRGATLNGELLGLGGASDVELSFQYWKKGDKDATYTFVNVETASSPDTYDGTVSGLDPNTTYVVEAVGYSDANGWVAGDPVEFTTETGYEVDTGSPSDVTDGSVTANGELMNLGGASDVELSFEYWVKGDKADTYSFANIETKAAPGTYNGSLTGLQANTTYVIQAVGYSDTNGWTTGSAVEVTTAQGYQVSTSETTAVTANSVTANGELVNLGGASDVELSFEYWVKGDKADTYSFANVETKAAPGTYNGSLTGLDSNTTYVVRAVGYSDAKGWTAGATDEFTTATAQNISTTQATDVLDTSATFNGELVSIGGADDVELNFQYWEKGAKSSTYSWASIETASAPGNYSGSVSGLAPNTTYVVEAVGYSNANGWSSGDAVELTTAPEYNVTTQSASDVTTSSATLNGELVGLGGADEVELNFEYWVKGDKENTYTFVNAETKSTAGSYAAGIDSLDSDTTYVVRAVGYTDEQAWETGETTEFTTN